MRYWKASAFHFFLILVVLQNALLQVVSLATRPSRTKDSKKTPVGNKKNKPKTSRQASVVTAPTMADLQKSVTPMEILTNVAGRIRPGTDSDGTLSSTLLVRLSKQMVALDNQAQGRVKFDGSLAAASQVQMWPWKNLEAVVAVLGEISWAESTSEADIAVEATKAAAVLSRLSPENIPIATWKPLLTQWANASQKDAFILQPHHLSGLKWSMDCFQLVDGRSTSPLCLSPALQKAYQDLELPFRIRTGFLRELHDLNVETLKEQVEFQVDEIRTVSKKVVKERRQTAWEGDEGVAAFAYSGKSMPRRSWSPLVRKVRDLLDDRMGVYYDGCLLNLYPDGGSGMRYHIDPDQGLLWDYTTTVVSIGATRKFAFRAIPQSDDDDSSEQSSMSMKPHVFTLLQGDCTEMFADCQERFQHTVKTAETNNETAPRASLVFKKTLEQ